MASSPKNIFSNFSPAEKKWAKNAENNGFGKMSAFPILVALLDNSD